MLFREESIIARAKQVLGVGDNPELSIKRNFYMRIAKYHPDKHGSIYEEQAKVLIEAYMVLTGRIKPLDCKLLEKDELVVSLLPEEAKPVKLGVKYEDWLKDTFYDFVKPRASEENLSRNAKKRTGL
jgi:hypothetical protein